MKLILENWRKYLLTEAAKGPEDLPDDIVVAIKGAESKDGRVWVTYHERGVVAGKAGMRSTSPSGRIVMRKASGEPRTGDCMGAYEIKSSKADDGWGPLLYDVAMEVAGESGLIADRSSLSDDAYAVWQYYMKSRSDVKKKQLDDLDNTLTPDGGDNCDTTTARDHETKEPGDHDHSFDGDDDMIQKARYLSPVMKVYTKETSTIAKLDAMNRLIRN